MSLKQIQSEHTDLSEGNGDHCAAIDYEDCWGQALGVAARLCYLPHVRCCFEVDGDPLLRLCSKGFLASQPPNFNPMDYFMWGYVESHINRLAHPTKTSLIKSI